MSEIVQLDIHAAMQQPAWREYWSAEKKPSANGAFIYVPPNTVMDKPLRLPAITADTLSHLIVIGESAQVTLIDEYQNDSTRVETQIIVQAQANLTYYKIQNQSQTSQHQATTRIQQQRDSIFSHYAISLGAQFAQDYLQLHLSESGACSHLYGLYLPFSDQRIEHHLQLEHEVAHTFSQQNYKGILGDKGQAVFSGKVNVHPQAQKTSASQSNQNLLLSDNAKIDTKPELEIYADDVKCSHGATVGQIDPEALFYLRSRGIDRREAHLILVKAFAEEILDAINHPEINDELHKKIISKINNNFVFGTNNSPPLKKGGELFVPAS